MKTRKVVGVISFIVVIAFSLLACYAIYNKNQLEVSTLLQVQRYGYVALFIFNFFLECIPQLITPVFTYIPAIILEMNIYFSIFIIVLGSICGSISGFFIGRKYGYETIEDIIGTEKSVKLRSFMDKYGRFAVSVAAITPLPYAPMIIGSLKLSKKNFLIFGLIPRSLMLIVFGYLFYLGIIVF